MIYPYSGTLFSIKRNDVSINARKWMNFGNIMQNERRKSQKTTHCLWFNLKKCPEETNLQRQKWISGCLEYMRRRWHPTPVLLPGESHGRRSLVGCSPRGRWGSDTTERLHFHFSLSCIGEGNGNPLQCSCLENSRDGGAWWAAVYGVTQSWIRLKQLSSSSRVHEFVWRLGWKSDC